MARPLRLGTDWLLSVFGTNRSQAQQAYVDFVSTACPRSSPWDDLKGQIYLGSNQFRERMLEHLDEPDRLSEVPAAQRRLEALLLEAYFCKTENRNAAIAEAYASGGYTLKEIGGFANTLNRAWSKPVWRRFAIPSALALPS